MKPLLEMTFTNMVRSKVGDFAGVVRLPGGESVVGSIDGVGTKVALACEVTHETGNLAVHEGIGEDLVNHSVNDIMTAGAQPIFLLNYFGYSDDRAKDMQLAVTRGMVRAALEVGVALIGGETAKMEGFYPWPLRAYDLVGAIFGSATDCHFKYQDGYEVRRGDKLIGLPSSGLHTNGFTFLREIFSQKHNEPYWKNPAINGFSIRELALRPHRCYYKIFKPLILRGKVQAIAHITGGGIETNLRRVLGSHIPRMEWRTDQWPFLFQFIKDRGAVPEWQMREEFNLGIGMVLVVAPTSLEHVTSCLNMIGEKYYVLGDVA
jgi:phosphoribosylformylglycinamidine cyclo-ligase